MKANTFVAKLALTAAVCSILATPAMAVIAYQNPTGTYGNVTGTGRYNVGMDFTVGATAINVTSLGAFDNGQNGLAADIEVAIYRVSDQTMMANAYFSAGTGDTLIGGSRFQDLLGPVELTSGTYRIVAGGYGGSTSGLERLFSEGIANTTTIVTDTAGGAITLGGNYASTWNPLVGIAFPTGAGPATVPGFAAGTFDFTPVPEASQFAMAGVGLLGLVYVGRCFVQRRKIVA